MSEKETSRKRKLDSDKFIFTNEAFSSVSNKPIATARRRRMLEQDTTSNITNLTKEYNNCNEYFINAGLEVKSIAEVKKLNPFEVVRKPPKKKKRDMEIEEACFENPALNLESAEKQFNPFEVVRQVIEPSQQCFVNQALNLRDQDVSVACNPFEVNRAIVKKDPEINNKGIVNLAVETSSNPPTNLKIGVPFKPTLGCRIDFHDMSLSQLTPSKCFAVPHQKRSLDAISEGSTTLDIDNELDCYQLELENSINEAKMQRGVERSVNRKLTLSPEIVLRVGTVEQKVMFSQSLAEISEGEEQDSSKYECDSIKAADDKNPVESMEKRGQNEDKFNAEMNVNSKNALKTIEDDVAVASESEDEDDDFSFKAPRFVRTYRRNDNITTSDKVIGSKESLSSLNSHKSIELVDMEKCKKTNNVKNIIRRSIRRILHPSQNKRPPHMESSGAQFVPSDDQEKNNVTTNIINTLRQSLRRKPKKLDVAVGDKERTGNISIIDTTERTIKLKAHELCEDVTNERKYSTRHSLRQSTREMRDQLMCTVFNKKHEQYVFCK